MNLLIIWQLICQQRGESRQQMVGGHGTDGSEGSCFSLGVLDLKEFLIQRLEESFNLNKKDYKINSEQKLFKVQSKFDKDNPCKKSILSFCHIPKITIKSMVYLLKLKYSSCFNQRLPLYRYLCCRYIPHSCHPRVHPALM